MRCLVQNIGGTMYSYYIIIAKPKEYMDLVKKHKEFAKDGFFENRSIIAYDSELRDCIVVVEDKYMHSFYPLADTFFQGDMEEATVAMQLKEEYVKYLENYEKDFDYVVINGPTTQIVFTDGDEMVVTQEINDSIFILQKSES